ncbi:peptidoglycan DD-metalloendopeptidase family protein [Nocardioides alcanivorans]|uniref:peptidoglycan DD-metalloendopeptidase family protein n=1 Tax=Nocardioides alcanivorans TaxID=2897352 RepID=UPI001F35E1C8|nr:peptidoglycan DD-metalloendopeptidase family protein [Nocardioides alcanivorans]
MLTVLVGGSSVQPAHGDEGQVPAGNGTWPLDPRPAVVAGFSPPVTAYGSGHRGIDLAGLPGQVVSAALPGTISFAGSIGGKPVVVVDHGSTRTTYEPVVAAVEVGDGVPGGAAVGHLVVARSHCPPAACLHLGWIRNVDDVYLDPLELFGTRRVRLWPWAGAPGPPARWRSPFGDMTMPALSGGLVGTS